MRAFFYLLALPLIIGACAPNTGTFDGGPQPDAFVPPSITAADIGTICEYDGTQNPTNTCKQGLTCMIVTADQAFAPFQQGDPRNLDLSVWEDHFSVYRNDGIDEGYCSLVGDFENPPACPLGTQLKTLAPRITTCVKSCTQATDCLRAGYTCDFRFLDLQGGHCVRQCQLDLPDCVRNGQLQRGDGTIGMHLAEEDLRGASVCDVTSGICATRTQTGESRLGMACSNGNDCLEGLACIQSAVLQSLDQSLDNSTPGVCVRPCKPSANEMMPQGSGCGQGEVCQAGFNFNHGNPLDDNLENGDGFFTANLASGTLNEAGGYCFVSCDDDANLCSSFTGTTCGPPNDIFGFPSNGFAMCLPDALRR